MPNVKGQPRKGGRAKGTPNKLTSEVIERLRAMGCDPIEGMARIAMGKYPCPECQGTKCQKYEAGPFGFAIDADNGEEMSCRLCHGTGFEPIAAKLAGQMFTELAQYVAPKRKAIEHSGPAGEPLKLEIVLNG